MSQSTRRRPSVEALEDRGLMTVTGLPWPDPGHLTLSFAPDGTPVGGTNAPSALFQTMASQPAATGWQATVLRAFQSWAAVANVNFGLVADSGAPFGQPGPLEGAAGAGDVRVAARPLSADVLALGTPFDLLGNGWSGSVLFNTRGKFGDGSNGTDDLLGAALHEAGHVLGLDDTATDATSVMYERDLPGRTGPSAADTAAVQALYGPRQPDAYEGRAGNDAAPAATPLGFLAGFTDLLGLSTSPKGSAAANLADADLTAAADRDVYAVSVPAGTGGPFAVTLRASGVSLVTARVTVTDALGQVVATAAASDPTRNDVTVTVPAAGPGSLWFVTVSGAQPGPFGVGAYRLAVGAPVLAAAAVAAPVTSGWVNPGHGPLDLARASTGTDARWPYLARAIQVMPGEVDTFRVRTDRATPPVLVAAVWGVAPAGASPRVDVLDETGRPLPAQLVSQNNGSWSVQFAGAAPGTNYLIRVTAADTSATLPVGAYSLGVTFRAAPVALSTYATGTATAAAPQDVRAMTVTTAQLVHFDLSALGGSDAAVKVTIYDAANRPVARVRAAAGGPAGSTSVLLTPGSYTVRVVAANRNGSPLAPLAYTLRGTVRSDPIGPGVIDTTGISTGPGSTGDPTFGNTDGGTFTAVTTLVDPASGPWTN